MPEQPDTLTPEQQDRLGVLTFGYLDNLLSEDELAELSAMIVTSNEARQLFTAYSQERFVLRDLLQSTHEEPDAATMLEGLAALEAQAGEVVPVDMTDEFKKRRLDKERQMHQQAASRSTCEESQAVSPLVIPKSVAWLGLAAVLGLVATLAVYFGQPAPSNTPTPPGPSVQAPGTTGRYTPAPAVATLLEAYDAAWSGPRPTQERLLVAGTYTLTRGWAQLRTVHGVDLVLEAPVTIQLGPDNAVRLREGRLVADVSERAYGFTVNTPGGRVVDYGTVFGVAVSDAGRTLAHVFEGEVAVDAGGPTAGGAVRLTENQAAMLREDGSVVREPAAPEFFAQQVPATSYQAAVMKSRPMCYWRGPIDKATRQVTDHGWLGADGQASAPLLNRATGFTQSDPSGALDFSSRNGASVSVPPHEALVLTASFTVEAWCWIEPGHEGFMRIVSTRTAGGGFGFGVNGHAGQDILDDWPGNVPVFTFYQEADYIGDVVLPEGRWVYLAAVINTDGKVAMFVDGSPVTVHEVIHTTTASASSPEVPLMIGRNPFTGQGIQAWQGRLDEVAIYDHVLSDEAVRKHYHAFHSP